MFAATRLPSSQVSTLATSAFVLLIAAIDIAKRSTELVAHMPREPLMVARAKAQQGLDELTPTQVAAHQRWQAG